MCWPLANGGCDNEQTVDQEDGRSLAKKNGDIPFFECSAKETINVREAFETLARKVLAKIAAEVMRTASRHTLHTLDHR